MPILRSILVLLLSLPFFAAGADLSFAGENPWLVRLEPKAPAEGEAVGHVPLAFHRASYEVDVLGAVAVGTLVQEFTNPAEIDVDARYVSSRPRGLMVDATRLEIGGVPEEIGEGFAVPPGETVTVRSSFEASLLVQNGLFRLRLPAVRPCGEEDEGCDDAAIPGSIVVRIHHDEPLRLAESASHSLVVDYEGDRTVIELAEGEPREGREFRLAYALGGQEDEPALMSYVGPERDGERDVMLVLAPTGEPAEEAVRPKQILFVLDTSGSMKPKDKLDQARLALTSCLEKLNASDRFNVVEFDSEFTLFRPEPAAAEAAPLQEAMHWLAALEPEGGTRLLPALGSTLSQPEDPELHRMIVLLTDGIVTDETQALDLLAQKLGDGRLFVVGIGIDVRKDTVTRLAEYGRGTAAFADDPESLERVMEELFGSISSPLAWDLQVDWGGADVKLVGSSKVPDLYAGRPVTVHARVRGDLPPEVSVKGTTMAGERSFFTVPDAGGRELPRIPRPREREEKPEKAPERRR